MCLLRPWTPEISFVTINFFVFIDLFIFIIIFLFIWTFFVSWFSIFFLKTELPEVLVGPESGTALAPVRVPTFKHFGTNMLTNTSGQLQQAHWSY